MKLTRLCKAIDSWREGECPAMYLADDHDLMVGQGKRLDAGTTAQLIEIAEDETGVAIPTETVLRAAGLFLAAQGRPAVATEVEAYLADRRENRS